MESLQNTFGEAAAAPVVEAKDAAKKEFVKGLKADLQDKLASDPDFVARLRSQSESLAVVATLGHGTRGNIVVDKEAQAATGERKIKETTAIVGYEVKNIGAEPITYKTEVWTMGEDGKYVADVVEKTINPGETVALTRKFMTLLCARPEISFTLSNGKIISQLKKDKPVDEMLSAFYFQFNDGTAVNDDKVKKAIDYDNDGVRVVKDEYIEAFGYLNNPKEKAGRKAKGQKLNIQDIMANYVNSLVD